MRSTMLPPRGVYLAALLSRFASTCTRRLSSPRTKAGDGSSCTVNWCWYCSIIGRACSTASATTRFRSSRVMSSATRPWVTRETSSRSSSRRFMWRAWRSMMAPALSGQRLVGAAHRQDLRRGADRRQRVAQFVRQHRQEFVLVAAGLLQRFGGAHPFGDVGHQPDQAIGPAGAAIQAAVRADPVDAAVGPDDAGLEAQRPRAVGRPLAAPRATQRAVGRVDVFEHEVDIPLRRAVGVAETLVVAQRAGRGQRAQVEVPFAEFGHLERNCRRAASSSCCSTA